MGYPTLDAALAFPNNVPPAKTHIVVTDTLQASANFLIHHFVGNQLKAGGNVILVGLSQIFNHYFLISRKLVQYDNVLVIVGQVLISMCKRGSICQHLNNQASLCLLTA